MIRIELIELYWWLLFGGLGLTLLYLLVGDILEGVFGGIEGIINPTLLFSALTIVGGAGVLLSKYSGFSHMVVLGISILVGIIAYILVYYFLILPMANAEVSTTFSIKELEGVLAEVTTSIPSNGYGEIILSTISGTSNYIAKSMDGNEIAIGSRVLVIRAEQDHLIVSKFTEFDELE